MGTAEEATDCRVRAKEMRRKAETIEDARDAKLYRAFADQFEQRARILEEATRQKQKR